MSEEHDPGFYVDPPPVRMRRVEDPAEVVGEWAQKWLATIPAGWTLWVTDYDEPNPDL